MLSASPALWAVISGVTIPDGFTFRNRMKKSCRNGTRTPDTSAWNQRPMGKKRRKTTSRRNPKKNRTRMIPGPSVEKSFTSRSGGWKGRGGTVRRSGHRPHDVTVALGADHAHGRAGRDEAGLGHRVNALVAHDDRAGGAQVGDGGALPPHQLGARQRGDVPLARVEPLRQQGLAEAG